MMNELARANVQDILSLTEMQWGMLVQYLKDPHSALYHEQLVLDFEGDIDEEALRAAWREVVAAHEMLRAVFRWERLARPVQVILRDHSPEFRVIDLAAEIASAEDREVARATLRQRAIARDAAARFDLRNVPVRLSLLRLDGARWTLIKTYHHILYDGWSTRILLEELFATYSARRSGIARVASHKAAFRDHVIASLRQDSARAETYWQTALADLAIQPFPDMRGPGAVAASAYGQLRRALPREAAAAAHRLAQANRVTLAQVLYVAWGLLLHKYTGTTDCVFSTTVSGREHASAGVERVIGLYIHAPPMRLRAAREERFVDVLRRAALDLVAREPFTATALPTIQRVCGLPHESRLADTIVAVQNFPFDASLSARVHVGARMLGFATRESSEVPLALAIAGSDELEIEATYETQRFCEAAVAQIVDHFGRLLIAAGAAPEAAVGALLRTRTLVGEARWHQLVHPARAWPTPVPEDVDVATLIERQVDRAPQAIAAVYEGDALTYAELDARAEALADALRARGAGPERFVGVLLVQGLPRVVALLAVIKTGAAYVPIEPNTPPARVALLLADCGALLVISDATSEGMALPCPVLRSDHPLPPARARCGRDVGIDHPLCIVYTSGSTGTPKGVVLEHASVLNLLFWHGATFGIAPGRPVLMLSDYSFDPHIEEIFGVLVHGATVHLAASSLLLDRAQLSRYLDDHAIYLISGVPSLLQQHLGEGERHPSLRIVISGGEKLDDAFKQRVLDAGYQLYNHYAPSECTVDAFSWRCDASPVHLGATIPDVEAYVLDGPDELAVDGLVGEIALAGRCLARGYVNQPQLTAERFVPHPFRAGARMYLSGDLGRRRFDGAIEWVARRDGQIKLRGRRVELGEIEAALLRDPALREAVVIAREDGEPQLGDGRYLCAYVVARAVDHPAPGGAAVVDVGQLRDQLATILPPHMVPPAIVVLDALPLTARGKIDRARLPSPRATAAAVVAPASALERAIAAIWAAQLGLAPAAVDVEQSFFEAGGHSLSAMRVVAAIAEALERPLPLAALFRAPTVRGLAAYLEAERAAPADAAIAPAAPREVYPVTAIQQRIYATAARLPDSTVYNMTGGVWIAREALDVARFARAFAALVARHEVLRTGFEIHGEDVVQRVHADAPAELARIRVDDPALVPAAVRAQVRAFELTRPPLARLAVIEAGATQLVLLDVHHIIADGAAVSRLVGELLALYRGEALPAPALHAKDHAVWLQSEACRDARAAHAAYWTAVLDGARPLDLPLDRPRDGAPQHRGATLAFALGAARRDGLAALARAHDATLFMACVAAFGALLGALTARDDVVIGSPVDARRRRELERMIGLLIHMLPLRVRPARARSFRELLDEVRAHVAEAFAHHALAVEDVVPVPAGRPALFDVALAFERAEELAEHQLDAAHPEWRAAPYVHAAGSAKFDLTLTLTEHADDLRAVLEYDTQLFLPETIANWRDKLCTLIDAVLRAPDAALGTLELRTEREQRLAQRVDVEFAF